MQIIIWRDRLLQIIIRRDRPFANDHPEGPATCKSIIESNSQCGDEQSLLQSLLSFI